MKMSMELELGGVFANNSTYDYDLDYEYKDDSESKDTALVSIPVLYSMVVIVGLLVNGLLLFVLAQKRRSWSISDTFMLNLIVADILLLLVTLPLWTAQAVQHCEWCFKDFFCKISGAVFNINFYCGIFLLACISLDRYLSIVHATQMYSRRNPWVVQVSCLAVWLFSMFLSIPDWIFLESMTDVRRENRKECVPNYNKFAYQSVNDYQSVNYSLSEGDWQSVHDWQLASRLLYHIVGFLIPSAVLIFCYSCILRRLRCGSQGLEKQKAFRVIVAVVVVFFICWTPYNITLMVDTLHSENNSMTCGGRTSLEKARVVTSSLGYLHCSLNPILYAFVGVKFRRQLLNILRSLGCKLKSSVKLQSTVSRRSSIWSESADTSNSIAI